MVLYYSLVDSETHGRTSCPGLTTTSKVKKLHFCSKSKKHVFEPRIGLHGGGLCPPLCSRTFASTLVTLQICGLIIVVDVDLVPLASLSRVKKSGSASGIVAGVFGQNFT